MAVAVTSPRYVFNLFCAYCKETEKEIREAIANEILPPLAFKGRSKRIAKNSKDSMAKAAKGEPAKSKDSMAKAAKGEPAKSKDSVGKGGKAGKTTTKPKNTKKSQPNKSKSKTVQKKPKTPKTEIKKSK